jgi:hypothetical protein
MSGVNGRANGSPAAGVKGSGVEALPLVARPPQAQFTSEQIKQLVAELEAPFEPQVIEWRVTNTAKGGKLRGQVIPYTDQRAYTDRLNTLVTPAGWTRKYAFHTSANFERGKDKKIVAKVLVTCELTIFGFNTHSATGEAWADDENAATVAEAQAFKRAASCFGLGRYLYYFSGEWVDLDEHKRPRYTPKLPKWATPEGWRQGLRPEQKTVTSPVSATNSAGRDQSQGTAEGDATALIREIEALEEPLGKRMYRGLLKSVARVWKPNEIRDMSLLRKVLEHMQGAERGLRRLDAALAVAGPEAMDPPLRSLQLTSLDRVNSLDALKLIVFAVEDAASKIRR